MEYGKGVVRPLELELQTVSYKSLDVGAGNWTSILWKSVRCS